MQPEMLILSGPMSCWRFRSAKRREMRLRDRDGAGGRQRAVVETRAGDDVADEADIGGRQVGRLEDLPDREEIVALHMRQHEILVMADAQLVEGVAQGEIGDGAHLLGRGVARNAAFGLERDIDDGVALDAMRRRH